MAFNNNKTNDDCDYCNNKSIFMVRQLDQKDFSVACNQHKKDAIESVNKPYKIERIKRT